MFFEVKPAKFTCPSYPTNRAYLIKDNWNDWFKYNTLFYLCFVDNKGILHEIGGTKIGQTHWKKDHSLEDDLQPHIPQTFDLIGKQFFSLGQDVEFYQKLNLLGEDIRVKILEGLRDVSYNNNLFESVIHENVSNIKSMTSLPLIYLLKWIQSLIPHLIYMY